MSDDVSEVRIHLAEWARLEGVRRQATRTIQDTVASLCGSDVADDEVGVFNGVVLPVCRCLALDDRDVWELQGRQFLTRLCNRHSVSEWVEQGAAKLAWMWLCQLPASCCDVAQRLQVMLNVHTADNVKPFSSTPPVKIQPVLDAALGGCQLANVAVQKSLVEGEGEGSLLVAKPLPPFTELLSIAGDLLFNKRTVVVHCALATCVVSTPALTVAITDDETLLLISLVFEKFVVGSRASHWHVLLGSCPKTFPTVPTFWPLSDLAELDGLQLMDDVLSKKNRLDDFVVEVNRLVEEMILGLRRQNTVFHADDVRRAFTKENLHWARAVFDSRAFYLNVHGEVILSLVPVADMINHGPRSDVLIRKIDECGNFCMITGAEVLEEERGRELWMSYGPLQNWELLLSYGFVLEKNTNDRLPFPLAGDSDNDGDDEDDEYTRRQRYVARKWNLFCVNEYYIPYSGVPPESLVACLRLKLAEVDDYAALESHGPLHRVQIDVERRVVQTIKDTVVGILEQFSTTLEDDVATLGRGSWTTAEPDSDSESTDEGEALTRNERHALHLRIGLKGIAARALEWCGEEEATLWSETCDTQ